MAHWCVGSAEREEVGEVRDAEGEVGHGFVFPFVGQRGIVAADERKGRTVGNVEACSADYGVESEMFPGVSLNAGRGDARDTVCDERHVGACEGLEIAR